MPFTFSLQRGVTATFPADQPVSLTAQIPEQSISLLSVFAPALRAQKLGGTVMANLSLGGTLRRKVITGTLGLNSGSIQPSALKTGFRNIDIAAAFNGTHGSITSSKIASTAGGYITLGGTVDVVQDPATTRYANAAQALLGNIRLNVTAHAADFTLNEPKIAALYNAGFQGGITGDVTASGPVLTPLIAGNMRIAKAVGILPTLPPNQGAAAPMPLFNPSFNLTIAVAPGGRVRSPQIDASADGTFQIARTLYQPDVTGDIYLRSGRFSFPTAIFRIVPTGVVHFVYNPPEETSEQVDITATTSLSISNALLAANPVGATGTTTIGEPVPGISQSQNALYTRGGINGSQRYTITVTIDGDLSRPNGLHLDFQSDPPGLTSQQILASLGGQQALNSLLVGGNVQQALQTEAAQIFTNYAIPTILAPFENSIASAFGLQEFDIDYEPESPLLISVVKQLGPRLDVRYSRYVNSRAGGAVSSTLQPLQYMISVDYSITNKLRLVVSTDDQHHNTFGIGGVFGF